MITKCHSVILNLKIFMAMLMSIKKRKQVPGAIWAITKEHEKKVGCL